MDEMQDTDLPVMLADSVELAKAQYVHENGVAGDYVMMRVSGSMHVDETWLDGKSVWMVALSEQRLPELVMMLTTYMMRRRTGQL